MHVVIELAFYLVATVGCGTFFTWLCRRVLVVSASVDRLRQHEHRQNNALQVVVSYHIEHQRAHERHSRDLALIRAHLGIPADQSL